jgi:hypothetical protein
MSDAAHRYWEAVDANDQDTIRAVVREVAAFVTGGPFIYALVVATKSA